MDLQTDFQPSPLFNSGQPVLPPDVLHCRGERVKTTSCRDARTSHEEVRCGEPDPGFRVVGAHFVQAVVGAYLNQGLNYYWLALELWPWWAYLASSRYHY